jgi:membrane protein DedA with SNARE-associated domain
MAEMNNILEFLVRHGYVVLLGWVFVEQLGLPIPSVPLLLAAGALAGAGRMNIFASLFITMFAALCADSLWYELGRIKGIAVLQLLCKISLEPDSCVRRTEGVFSRQGARSLIFAKFLPGVGAVAPPLAGVFHMRVARFMMFDSIGTLLWAGTFLGAGFVFSGQIEQIAAHLAYFGGHLGMVLLTAFALYIAYKFLARQRFIRALRIARITVSELKEKIDAGEEMVVVDLRHSVDFEADPQTIPGAFRMDAAELEEKNDRLPRDRDVILYCT